MNIEELVTKRNVVMAYNQNSKSPCYLRKMFFETKTHYDRVVSVNLLTSTIDTISLGDGKVSTKIADPSIELTDVKPGVFDIQKDVLSSEIKDFDDKVGGRGLNYLATITQNVNDHLSQLCNTLACKSLHGTYKHKATGKGNFSFNLGNPVKINLTAQKVTASSSPLDLSAQADEMRKVMLDPPTSKEDVRILCSKEFYTVVTAIVKNNQNNALIQTIDEPGVKIDGWYYINDQASYKETDNSVVNAVGAKGAVMIDKSKKGKVFLCDLGLEADGLKKGESTIVVTAEGLPFTLAVDKKKGGLLNEMYFMAAPIAVPCLSAIVHGQNLV